MVLANVVNCQQPNVVSLDAIDSVLENVAKNRSNIEFNSIEFNRIIFQIFFFNHRMDILPAVVTVEDVESHYAVLHFGNSDVLILLLAVERQPFHFVVAVAATQ